MEGLPFKEAARGLASEIKHLASQKHTLEEELLQCKADKDFVWNLWKRLQTEKPDMASVISMVVSREKEKAERKDLKILEILRLKDEKIVEMREALNADKEEMKMNKERLHDLLIENDELKQKLDEHENELSSKMKEMEERTREIEEKNQYLSQLVKAYQEEKEAKDKELKDNLEQIDSEKNGLKSKIKYLEDEVEKLNEDRTSLGEAMKTNANLKEQIQEMEKTLQNLKSNSESCEKQYDEAVTTLRIRENHLQDKDKEVIALRERMIDFRNSHDQALVKIREQTEMIEHLQGMQDQVYRVMEDHKQSYEREITSLHKEVEDLQHQCTEYHRNEDHFQNEIGALKQSKASDFEDIMAKDQQIEELQKKIIEIGRTHSSPQKHARFEEPCKHCKELEEKLENLSAEREDLSDVLQEKSRRISSLEKTIKSSLTSKVSAKKDLLVETYHDKLHPGSPVNQKINQLEKRIQDLKSLIGLKDSELTEVRRAHNQRQQRYQLLKENYGLVQNQLKTFENEPVERTPPRRPSERALRHENSDGVWNELTYYRGEYEKLNKDRHDVLEELDILCVEHANDLTTIQELRLCLEEEKEGLLNQLEEDKKKTIDYARESKKSELLKDEISLLRKTEQESKSRIQELEEEIVHCKQELKLLAEDNANLKRNAVHLEKQLNSASCEIEDRIVECKRLKETLGENEMNISPIKFAEVKTKDNELIKQQAKDIDMYDLQLKKIAERILSPSKQHKKDLSPTRKESQGTQTIEMSRTADFSSFVDFNQSDLEVGVVEVDARAKNVQLDEKVDNLKKISSAQTPRGKKIATTTKKTPVKGEWSGMRQRILSLTQQVAAIRSAKDKAVKALNEEKTTNENLQSELNNVLQRFQVSKNTVQTLTDDLKKCLKEKEEILADKENADQNDAEMMKRKYEEKLRITSSELSRLNALVKTHRNEKNDLKEKLSDSQERLTRAEKDLAQKKTFVEEMKNKLRQAKDAEERSDDTVKDLEERIKRLTERDTQKKLQLDSLKRQLENEAKEKAKLSQQYLLSVEEVKKKSHLLADSRSLHAQADKAVSEMEAAATEQLQSLASKSETALKALRGKLSKAEARIEEFQALIKTLTDELIADNERTCFEIAQFEEQLKKDELDKPSSKHARHLACSILNMTSDDLDEFMKENEKQSKEQTARRGREREWKEAVDMLLKKEVPFAVPLIEVLLDIIEGSKSLGGRLLQLTNKNT